MTRIGQHLLDDIAIRPQHYKPPLSNEAGMSPVGFARIRSEEQGVPIIATRLASSSRHTKCFTCPERKPTRFTHLRGTTLVAIGWGTPSPNVIGVVRI
jgi:hypothetical protein